MNWQSIVANDREVRQFFESKERACFYSIRAEGKRSGLL